MSSTARRISRLARAVRQYFFPRRLDTPPHVAEMLQHIYPSVDWSYVRFYEGWPHLLNLGGFQAITLPDPHSLYRINIYFQPDAWRPGSPAGLSTIIHEGYHVLQIQRIGGGYGIGLLRPFLVAYLAGWARNGFAYAGHSMEEEAYRVAGRRGARFEQYLETVSDHSDAAAIPRPEFQETELQHTFRERMELVGPRSGQGDGVDDRTLRPLMAAYSNAAWMPWTVAWAIVVLILWLLWLGVELIGAVTAGALWLISSLGRP